MVETVEVKLESDREAFLPQSSSSQNQAASQDDTMPSETNVFDHKLATDDFIGRVCLVKLRGKDANGNVDTKLWPAIRYSSQTDLFDAVRKDVGIGAFFKIAGHFDQQKRNGPIGPIFVYLFGMQTIEESFITVGEGMVDSIADIIDDLSNKEEYKYNQKFQAALKIVMDRTYSLNGFESESDETVAYNLGDNLASPPSKQANVEVITIEESPVMSSSGMNTKKRTSESKDNGEASKKKKKSSKQTPKAKSRLPPRSIVTPSPAEKSDEYVAQKLAVDCSKAHNVMKNEEAMKLLTDKFDIKCVDGNYYLPPQNESMDDDKPVASTLEDLRKNLCEKGLPKSIQPLSEDEKVDIARWVRYTHITGLTDGQHINPDDLGMEIYKFMNGWTVLCDNFGCRFSAGKYHVPLSPDGGDVRVFDNNGVDSQFARFGVQCIPDDPGDRLSKRDRLSIELFFATPSFKVLNTL